MKTIFIVRQSLDIFWIVEYNINGNQDKNHIDIQRGDPSYLSPLIQRFIYVPFSEYVPIQKTLILER